MSSDIDIRGGGVVAVDTATLRTAATRFGTLEAELAEIAHRVGSVQNRLFVEGDAAAHAVSDTYVAWARLRDVERDAAAISAHLEAAAALYDLVDLNAQHLAAFVAGDRAAMARIDAQRDAIMAEHPDAMENARGLELDRTVMWPSELVRQATQLGFELGDLVNERGALYGGFGFGTLALGFAVAAGTAGLGRLPRDARLQGAPEAVTVSRIPPTSTATPVAPTSIAAAVNRIPGGGDARVRVEKYTMPDGSRQFAVYVAGTRSPWIGGSDPWDNASNAQLHTGRTSASYTATEKALAAAGARRGDVVHAFGFSQGAMITAHLALDSGYDVKTLVSLGSPVDADVGERTLSVSIRHLDDPVVALAGGGYGAAVGAPGSFVAETTYDPATGPADLAAPAHRLEAYQQTTAQVEATGDPRVAAVDDVLGELAGATSVEVSEFGAERAP